MTSFKSKELACDKSLSGKEDMRQLRLGKRVFAVSAADACKTGSLAEVDAEADSQLPQTKTSVSIVAYSPRTKRVMASSEPSLSDSRSRDRQEFLTSNGEDNFSSDEDTASDLDHHMYTPTAYDANLVSSRGDKSGTHQKEMEIWKKVDITPEGSWYIVTNDFMTASLKRASTENAYFMTDSSTWVAEKDIAPNLVILYRGDKFLVNTYDALAAPASATENRDIAVKFIQFVASDEGQAIIRNYGKSKYKEPLYNDAAYAKQYVH